MDSSPNHSRLLFSIIEKTIVRSPAIFPVVGSVHFLKLLLLGIEKLKFLFILTVHNTTVKRLCVYISRGWQVGSWRSSRLSSFWPMRLWNSHLGGVLMIVTGKWNSSIAIVRKSLLSSIERTVYQEDVLFERFLSGRLGKHASAFTRESILLFSVNPSWLESLVAVFFAVYSTISLLLI